MDYVYRFREDRFSLNSLSKQVEREGGVGGVRGISGVETEEVKGWKSLKARSREPEVVTGGNVSD